jgi:hypothetical protein
MTNDNQTETNHAKQNAAAWLDNIVEMIQRLEHINECEADPITQKYFALTSTLGTAMPETSLSEDELGDQDKRETSYDAAKRSGDWDGSYEFKDVTENEAILDYQGVCIHDEQYHNEDDATRTIDESPLSVQIRSDWYNPGSLDATPAEYEILLSTGGPALRIYGEIGEFNQPDTALLQYQDWGTPWTRYYIENEEHDRCLLEFARRFYFGE